MAAGPGGARRRTAGGRVHIPRILQHIADGELHTEHLATHVMPLEDGPRGYQMFKDKTDGCVRAVFQPGS